MGARYPKGTARVVNSTRVRSTLEQTLLEALIERDAKFIYEGAGLKYTTHHTYKPDFVLITKHEKLIYVEAKGWFTAKDRQKMIEIKKQHPKADIRFVFQRAQNKLSKNSKTTYAQWANKWKFPWSEKYIPTEWINE